MLTEMGSKKTGTREAGSLLVALFAAVTLVVLAPSSARAQIQRADQRPNILRDVGIDQKLNQQVPLDIKFRDETGRSVQLGEYFGKKPVILSLVYFDCPMLCTMVENGLLQALKEIKFTVGDQFEVVTVSFDPHDTPEVAAAKKAVYIGLYNRPGAAEGWHFLTGDEASIRALTQAVGFRYAWDPDAKQFAHATAIMVLTPEGKLSRYFYGIQYPPGGLRLSLVEASQHKIGSPVDAILLFCCAYNPATGKYGLLVSRLLEIAAALVLLTLGTLIIMLKRAEPHAHA